MKKEIAEVSIKLIEKDGKRILITTNFGTLEDFAEITQILFENKLEKCKIDFFIIFNFSKYKN